ncbi:unannotated protein [freshwater metagenome]|uniref:Unannotated protein n=1 Tax=freshwater metagenome TaxID=449393 RepID=A0A6J7F349_9ZZZZ
MKLKALVRDHLGHDLPAPPAEPANSFGRGAALTADGTAWVLLDEQPERSLGAALAWASRQPALTDVAIIAESATGVLARRAALFGTPITVWVAVERLLVPAVTDPYPARAEVDPRHEVWRTVITEAGAEPAQEHGVLAGEIRGLEICRVVTDAYTDETRLEVGVGAHDRESFMMLHGNRPTAEALAGVVDAVVGHRRVDAPLHPLNRLGAERFLRWQVIQAPERVGAAWLRVADPPVPRPNLKDPVPCVAVGESASGEPMVVVCSVGIDLDLVPFAVDARQMHAPDALLVLVVPERDASPVTRRLMAMVARPVGLVVWA